MNWESAVLREVEFCLSHYRLYVIPRDTRAVERANLSIWALCDPAIYAGIIWRQNTGFAKYGRRGVKFGVPGMGDFTGWLFASGQRIELEVKAQQSNGKLTPDQAARLILCQHTSVFAAVVRSYEDCAKFCEWMGLRRSQ